jgi:SH3-like domain-containing protein
MRVLAPVLPARLLPSGLFPWGNFPWRLFPCRLFPCRLFPWGLFPGRLVLLGALAIAPAGAWAQTGTLQVPAHRTVDTPVKPPAAAPTTPVHQDGPVSRHTPVVRPHGREHAEKPPAKAPLHPPPGKPPEVSPVAPEATAPSPAAPAKPADEGKVETGALKLPRFASLRSDEVNLRAGPGTRYPIEWVYKRRDLPVEIEREFEVWRAVRDIDGIQGWVHQATLTGRRSFIVKGADATLRADPKDTASPVAILKVGVMGRIRACAAGSDWCELQTGSYRGYLKREQIWGVLPDEVIAP